MSENTNICEKIPKNIRNKIKTLIVINDNKGSNIIYQTNDEKVFGFGNNIFGCIGLGHNDGVNEPQEIQELSYQPIQTFYIGLSFMLALIVDSQQVFGSGGNGYGQLGKGYKTDKYYAPDKLSYFKHKPIKQISCGSYYAFALSKDGLVYGWGYNKYGQIGHDPNDMECILEPVHLDLHFMHNIISICCLYNRSFALTADGSVYC